MAQHIQFFLFQKHSEVKTHSILQFFFPPSSRNVNRIPFYFQRISSVHLLFINCILSGQGEYEDANDGKWRKGRRNSIFTSKGHHSDVTFQLNSMFRRKNSSQSFFVREI